MHFDNSCALREQGSKRGEGGKGSMEEAQEGGGARGGGEQKLGGRYVLFLCPMFFYLPKISPHLGLMYKESRTNIDYLPTCLPMFPCMLL